MLLPRLLSRDMVDIYVGQENTHWILHEKLLCYRSKFFRNVFYNKEGSKNHAFGLPDEEDGPFKLFVGWLYSETIYPPKEEKDLGPLFDLYLMGEKWEIKKLVIDVLETVRTWYHDTDTWPALRRVQYIYSNTDVESPMRQLLVNCVARMLVLRDGMPPQWENALKKNGQLAVDIILCVQKWHVDAESVPDAREEGVKKLVEESEQKVEVKTEDDEAEAGHDLEELVNGVNGFSHDDDDD
jgi:hypothetical protein